MSDWTKEDRWLLFGAIIAVTVLLYALIDHASGIIHGLTELFVTIAAAVGGTAATAAFVTVPVTVITVLTFASVAEDRPKLYIVAMATFLNPLFIDFMKNTIESNDRIHSEIMQMLFAAVGALSFLIASSLWTGHGRKPAAKGTGVGWSVKSLAIVLYLMPMLCMIGYLSAHAHEYRDALNIPNVIGVSGLLVTALVGISLSKYYEAP